MNVKKTVAVEFLVLTKKNTGLFNNQTKKPKATLQFQSALSLDTFSLSTQNEFH